MTDTAPHDDAEFLLKYLTQAQWAGKDLGTTASDVYRQHEWSDQRATNALLYAIEKRWIKAHVQRSGDGKVTMAVPSEVTGIGQDWYKRLSDEFDQELPSE